MKIFGTGAWIQDARIRASIGLKQLAREVNIDPSEMRKIEVCEAEPLSFLMESIKRRIGMMYFDGCLRDNYEF